MKVRIEPWQRDGTQRVFTSVSTGAYQTMCDETGRPIDLAPELRRFPPRFRDGYEARLHFMKGMEIFAYFDGRRRA